jgi:hypothetical protein
MMSRLLCRVQRGFCNSFFYLFFFFFGFSCNDYTYDLTGILWFLSGVTYLVLLSLELDMLDSPLEFIRGPTGFTK